MHSPQAASTKPSLQAGSSILDAINPVLAYRQWDSQRTAITRLEDINRSADLLCCFVVALCFVFACLQGYAYGRLEEALWWGAPVLLASFAFAAFHAGKPLTMHLLGFALISMAALHVQIARGLTEYHFSFFILLPVLLAYRNPAPLISAGAAIIAHHVAFDVLQRAGFNCYVFRGPFDGLPAISLHGFYVVVSVFVLSAIANSLRKHAVAAQESVELLSHLNREQNIDLKVRAQPDATGRISELGRMYNDYADNMTFVVSAFNMLRKDIDDLRQITEELGASNNHQLADSQQASVKLRDFVQSLAGQSRTGQSTAELSKKVTEDCFDLVNQFNQSIDKLQRIGKQAFDSGQAVLAAQRAAADQQNDTLLHQLGSAHQGLDDLNERTQQFLNSMDSLKSGLNAIENQVLTLDHAIHHGVESSQNNQRAGWEVLGAVEHVQTRAETVLNTLQNTVSTIHRSNQLIAQLESRLSRFEV